MRSRQVSSKTDLDVMLKRAMELPGVAETMKMYEHYRETVASAKQYLRFPEATSTVSDSSS
ncbi:MAG TPA: hypothetical protein VGS11_00165 [Candidatus Bathyarchaeia archaeon]|nr:hypothetical protein [Candidatus Bathyarchaeia archaeon]